MYPMVTLVLAASLVAPLAIDRPNPVAAPASPYARPSSTAASVAARELAATDPQQGGQQGQQTTQPPQQQQTVVPGRGGRGAGVGNGAFVRGGPVSSDNVRLDISITDTYGGTPTKKTVSLLVAENENATLRSASSGGGVIINIDARAYARSADRDVVSLTVQYTPMSKPDSGGSPANIQESITTVVPDGKLTMISQSADPGSDRKVTLEVTATVIK
jgi:hypothetical protein